MCIPAAMAQTDKDSVTALVWHPLDPAVLFSGHASGARCSAVVCVVSSMIPMIDFLPNFDLLLGAAARLGESPPEGCCVSAVPRCCVEQVTTGCRHGATVDNAGDTERSRNRPDHGAICFLGQRTAALPGRHGRAKAVLTLLYTLYPSELSQANRYKVE